MIILAIITKQIIGIVKTIIVLLNVVVGQLKELIVQMKNESRYYY